MNPPRGQSDQEAGIPSRPPAGHRRLHRKLRCAIVGLGRIGSTLEDDRLREKPASHAGAIRANRNCLLTAGCDLREDRRRAFVRRWRCPHVYSDLGAMLEAENPDILHVATPTESHGTLVTEAARRGVPLIVCEKPLCSNAEEAREALAACREYGTTLLVNHERRYSRDYVDLRRLVRERRYGELLSIHSRLFMGRGRRPADILLEDGTHMVDVIRFLTGEEIETRHTEGNPRAEAGGLQVLFRCGEAVGFLEVSGRHQALVFEVDLEFERGRLRVGNGVYERWESAPSRHYEQFYSLQRIRVPRSRTTGYFAGMLTDAVAVARDPDRAPVSTGEDGLRAVEVIEQMLATGN